MADADPQNHDDNDIDMEKPCEICGDIGFINAIRDCSLCQITREHAYCMKVMLEAEADAWICEECVSAKVALSSPAPNKQPEDARAIFMIKKPPQNTKVKYITPEEVRALESRAMKNDSILESKTHLSPRSLIAKASFCQRGLSALVSNSSAKPGPQIGVTGFEVSLNEEPHLEKNVSTADPCTFGDLVKDNSEKCGIHPVHTSFQLVQCLPAVDLVVDEFSGHRNRARIPKTHFQPQKGPISLMAVVLSPASLGSATAVHELVVVALFCVALIVVQERNLLLTPNSLPWKGKRKRIKGHPKPEDSFLVIGLPIKHAGTGHGEFHYCLFSGRGTRLSELDQSFTLPTVFYNPLTLVGSHAFTF